MPLLTFLASVVIISFYNTLVNSKERVFLGSVSCSSKLLKTEEDVLETSDLQPVGQKHHNLDLELASEVGSAMQD